MSAALARSRDRAVSTLRALVVTLVLLGLTATGALAGVFARQQSFTSTDSAEAEAPKAGAAKPSRQVLMVVHHPASVSATTPSTPAGAPPAAAPAVAPAAPAPAPAPAPVPTVSAPAAPAEPAASSSGSDPG